MVNEHRTPHHALPALAPRGPRALSGHRSPLSLLVAGCGLVAGCSLNAPSETGPLDAHGGPAADGGSSSSDGAGVDGGSALDPCLSAAQDLEFVGGKASALGTLTGDDPTEEGMTVDFCSLPTWSYNPSSGTHVDIYAIRHESADFRLVTVPEKTSATIGWARINGACQEKSMLSGPCKEFSIYGAKKTPKERWVSLRVPAGVSYIVITGDAGTQYKFSFELKSYAGAPTSETTNEACSDLLDNDGNGKADCDDFACQEAGITVCH